MKKLSLAFFALALAAVSASFASATTYTVSTSGVGGTAYIDLQNVTVTGGLVTGIGSGSFVFIPGAGTFNFVGLLTGSTYDQVDNGDVAVNGTGTPGTYDQALSLTAPYLDAEGLALVLNGSATGDSTNDELQIWVSGGKVHLADESDDPTDGFNIDTFSNTGGITVIPNPPPSDTPEPSSLVLLGSGLLAIALVFFKKSKPVVQALNS